MDRDQILEEGLGAGPPGEPLGMGPAGGALERQGPHAGQAQVGVGHAHDTIDAPEDVARTCHRKGRHRGAARQRLDHHQPERIRQTGKHQHVGAGEGPRQFAPGPWPDEADLRIGAFQRAQLWAAADHEFRPR